MKHLKKFNEAEEHIFGNPAFPEGYLQNALNRRKLQISEQGRGNFSISKAQKLVAGKERELEELLNKTMNKLYSGLIERYNITLDIKYARNSEINNILTSNESYQEEKWKRKVANLITQGEAKNMMHVIHSPDITEGVKEIFGEEKGMEIIETWSDIVKAVDIIDMNRDINYFDMSYITSTIQGVVKIDWIPKEEGGINEDIDEDEFWEDPFDEDWNDQIQKELQDSLNKGDEEKVDDIIDKENLPEDTVRKKFNPKIIVRGADFTLLIHETIKGIYNVLSMAGVPKDKKMARRILGDLEQSLREEPEEFKWGPIVAADLRDFLNEYPDIDKYPNMREEFWIQVLKLPTSEFFPIINAILSKTEVAKIKSNVIFKKVIKSIEKKIGKKMKADYEKKLQEYEEKIRIWKQKQAEKRKQKSQTRRIEEPKQSVEPTEIDYRTLSLNQLNDLQNQAIDDGDFQIATKIANEIDRRK